MRKLIIQSVSDLDGTCLTFCYTRMQRERLNKIMDIVCFTHYTRVSACVCSRLTAANTTLFVL